MSKTTLKKELQKLTKDINYSKRDKQLTP